MGHVVSQGSSPKRGSLAFAAVLSFGVLAGASEAGGAQETDLDGLAYDRGSPDAPVVIVEYGDFACSACGEFARDTWPAIYSEFIETGRVFWRFVPFELGFRNSDESVRLGHCGAVLGDFWGLHDALFESQRDWLDERKPKDKLFAVAAALGHDLEAVEQCYDDNPGKDRTRDANRAARKDGVRATPTFFIDGFQVQGALPFEMFEGLIEAAEEGR